MAIAVGAPSAQCQTWRFEPGVNLQETLTDNVNLQPSGLAKADLVTEITPTLHITEKSSHTSLNGTVALQSLLYARTGAENNQIYPVANLVGDVDFFDRRFVVEGEVIASQQFFSPFGAQPINIANATQNRYTSVTYRVSPYFQGVTPGNLSYLLRNNSTWTNLSNTPIQTNNSYTSEWVGRIESARVPLGWSADMDLTNVKFNNQAPQKTNLGRVSAHYDYNEQLHFRADVGYEDNQYPLSSSSGAIYGVGFEWRPSARTSANVNWEQRFFGSSYLVTFDHRTPLSTWNFSASRNITSYPQQLASLPAGNVQGLLNQLFLSRIPDPAQRQTAIDSLIQSQGLPANLTSPVNLYSQQILLAENASASVGILGARNSVLISLYYLREQPINAAGNVLPPILSNANNDTTQLGVGAIWTHNLTSTATMNLSINGSQSKLNAPLTGKTNTASIRLGVTQPISPRTTVFAGARYQVSRGDLAADYNEAAIFAGLNYAFK
ncbi:MAG TPA: TIGR03016 family PEP-CTERM system-associated outer membrane protein [Casimicrobiaceae bacterium]|nr:TIGR03016 family PEP-CTERM system-associated outer membrane protein [Casimicrobiaceae bacterium]